MINVSDLHKLSLTMQDYKLVKKIKVTTQFADYLDANIPKLEDKFPDNCNGLIGQFDGIPVEIDDEIDGLYEFVY